MYVHMYVMYDKYNMTGLFSDGKPGKILLPQRFVTPLLRDSQLLHHFTIATEVCCSSTKLSLAYKPTL